MSFVQEYFSIEQIPAWIAATIYIISYLKSDSRKTIFLWMPADFFMAIHFFMMNAYFFIITAIGGAFRSLIATYFSSIALRNYLILYLTVILCAVPFFYNGIAEICAVIGTFFFSLSVWMKDRFLWHRFFAIVHQINWFIAFFILESYGGQVLISFMLMANLIGISKYLYKHRFS